MNRLIQSVASSLALATATFAPFLPSEVVKAQSMSMDVCENASTMTNAVFASTYSSGCSATPERYSITIYEMGLCTSNPISGGSLNKSTCTTTFESSGGQQVDLAGSASITLDESNATKPPSDTYSYGYMVMSNTFGLRGSLQTSTTTWVSDGTDFTGGVNVADSGSAANFNDTLTSFGSGGCTSSASATMSLGTMSAFVADSSLNQASSCTGVARIVGAFAPTSAYTVTDASTALKITFNVTNKGMTVMPGTANIGGVPTPVVSAMASGPFEMEITIVE